jgi:hypothetical protein
MSKSLFISLPDVEDAANISSLQLGSLISLKGINVFASIDSQKANIISNGEHDNLDDMIIARSIPILPHFALIPDKIIKENTFGQTWTIDYVPARRAAFSEFTDPRRNPSNYAVLSNDFEQLYDLEYDDFSIYSQLYLAPNAKKKFVFSKPLSIGYNHLFIHKRDLQRLTSNQSRAQLEIELKKTYEQLEYWKIRANSNNVLPANTNPRLILACQLNNDHELCCSPQDSIADFIEANNPNIKRTMAEAIAMMIGRRARGQRGKTKLTRQNN